MIGAALREGYVLPLFIQGDHCQVNAKKYQADPEGEVGEVKKLIGEEIGAGFFNIDIDTSTLVDLEQPTLDAAAAAQLRARRRDHRLHPRASSPRASPSRSAAEIGEVGMKNSTVEELHAFMDGYQPSAGGREGALEGLSKISVQTGTSHGGVVLPDGSIAEVKLDLAGARGALRGGARRLRPGGRRAARRQHAARPTPSATSPGSRPPRSTSPPTSRTSSSTIPGCPPTCAIAHAALAGRERRRRAEAQGHRRAVLLQGPQEGDRAVQAGMLVASGEDVRAAIAADLEKTFAFLFEQLKVNGTEKVVNRFVAGSRCSITRRSGRRWWRPRTIPTRGIGGADGTCASRAGRSCTSSGAATASAKWLVLGRGARRRSGAAVRAAHGRGDPPACSSASCGSSAP